MKIGMATDSLGHLPYAEMLNTAAALGISGVEFNACNWTSAPHFNLAGLVKDGALRIDLVRVRPFIGVGIDFGR